MSNYSLIATAFTQVGLNENSLVSEPEMIRALDNLARRQGLPEFDRSVADELWQETNKANGDQVYVRDFINTVIRGEGLVRSSMNDLERSLQYKTNESEKNEDMLNIASYSEDLKYLTLPFGLVGSRHTAVLDASHLSTHLNNNQSRVSNSTVIFSKEIPENQSGSSTDLKVLFLLTIILTCIELIIMFHKHHFYSLLAYLSVFAIFFLGYFDMYYLRFVKINLLISVVLDVVWLIFNFNEYWNPRAETQHSSLQWGYLKFVLFFLVALMFFKIVSALILIKYRSNSTNMRKIVTPWICGTAFSLTGSQNSPIAKFFTNSNNHI